MQQAREALKDAATSMRRLERAVAQLFPGRMVHCPNCLALYDLELDLSVKAGGNARVVCSCGRELVIEHGEIVGR